jgi:hypothetical protein
MREAALEIARIGDHYPFSAVERGFRALRRALARTIRSWRRSSGASPLPTDDPRLLADLGLRPTDLPDAGLHLEQEERWRRA